MTDGYKKEMNKEKKKKKMAEKKALWESNTFSSSLACPLHGFLQIDCIICMTNLKKRLAEAVVTTTPTKE